MSQFVCSGTSSNTQHTDSVSEGGGAAQAPPLQTIKLEHSAVCLGHAYSIDAQNVFRDFAHL